MAKLKPKKPSAPQPAAPPAKSNLSPAERSRAVAAVSRMLRGGR